MKKVVHNLSPSIAMVLPLTCQEIFSFPRDIILSVLLHWLTVTEVANLLDVNLINHEFRAIYLDLLRGVVVPAVPADHFGLTYLQWINTRGLKLHTLYLEKLSTNLPMENMLEPILQPCRTTLVELSLSHCYSLDNAHLAQLIETCQSTLASVEIDNCYMVTSLCLQHLFVTAKKLKKLSLIGFDFTDLDAIDASAPALAPSLAPVLAPSLAPTLTPVLAPTGIASLKIITRISTNAIGLLLHACPQLTHLDYELDDAPHDKAWIDLLVLHCPAFRTLQLNGYKVIDQDFLAHVAVRLPHLQGLSIEEGIMEDAIIDNEFFHIAIPEDHHYHPQRVNNQYKVLKELKDLKELGWHGPCVKPIQMLCLVSAFNGLKKVDFGYNIGGIDDSVIIKLVRCNLLLEEMVLPSSLEADVHITDVAVKAIVKYSQHLRVLTIPCGEGLTDESMSSLSQANALQELYLDRIPNITEEAVMELGINSEHRLTKLSICNLELSPDVRRILCSLSIQLTYIAPDEEVSLSAGNGDAKSMFFNQFCL